MLLTLKLKFYRLMFLLRSWRKPYIVASTPKDFKRLLLLNHNRRRERGNVQLHLGKRRGRFHGTN